MRRRQPASWTGVPLALAAGLSGPLLCACGAEVDLDAAARRQAVVYGVECTDPAANSTVALLFAGRVSYGDGLVDLRTVLCSGVLIAPDAVLTAAHCLNLAGQGIVEVQSASWQVSAQEDLRPVYDNEADFPASSVVVTSTWVHPSFDANAFLEAAGLGNMHDVGIAFLAAPLDGVPVAYLLEDEATLAVGSGVTVVGYGTTDAQGAVPGQGTTGRRRCAFSFVNTLGDFEVQVGSGSASARRCFVDSGGATLLRSGETSYVAALGSRSFSSGCSEGGVDTRLDTLRADIDAALVTACDDGARAACDPPGLSAPAPLNDAGGEAMLDAAGTDANASTGDASHALDAGAGGMDGPADDDAGLLPPDDATPLCACASADEQPLPTSAFVLAALYSLARSLRRRRRRP